MYIWTFSWGRYYKSGTIIKMLKVKKSLEHKFSKMLLLISMSNKYIFNDVKICLNLNFSSLVSVLFVLLY